MPKCHDLFTGCDSEASDTENPIEGPLAYLIEKSKSRLAGAIASPNVLRYRGLVVNRAINNREEIDSKVSVWCELNIKIQMPLAIN